VYAGADGAAFDGVWTVPPPPDEAAAGELAGVAAPLVELTLVAAWPGSA
jgi:hypothetical protein